jgi:hypothetical protein
MTRRSAQQRDGMKRNRSSKPTHECPDRSYKRGRRFAECRRTLDADRSCLVEQQRVGVVDPKFVPPESLA